MQERKSNSTWYTIKVVLIILATIGGICYSLKVWHITVDFGIIQRALAIFFGIMAYLYTVVFSIGSIVIARMIVSEDEWTYPNNKAKMKEAFWITLLLILVSILIQLFYWGIILSNTNLLIIAGVVVLIIAVPILKMLKKR